MNMGEVYEWKTWRDILAWVKENNYKNIAKKMETNNAYWNSCGEFGRSQVTICDSLRFASDDAELYDIADAMEQELADDWCVTLA